MSAPAVGDSVGLASDGYVGRIVAVLVGDLGIATGYDVRVGHEIRRCAPEEIRLFPDRPGEGIATLEVRGEPVKHLRIKDKP